jgi:hypothetical protein
LWAGLRLRLRFGGVDKTAIIRIKLGVAAARGLFLRAQAFIAFPVTL